MKVPSTTTLSFPTLSPLLTAGKIIVGYFLDSPRIHEFFSQIDTYAIVSNWSEEEKSLIAKAKLQSIALQYVQGRDNLARDACTYTITITVNRKI
jgi:hypothetical protein